MFNQFLEKSQSLYKNKEPFAMAFIVNRQIPSSGKPGDKAIIEKNGKINGWIGGGCTRGIVLKEAGLAMQEGKPRLVRISPQSNGEAKDGVKEYHMTCHSGGTVEVYIEPVLPRPEILILGKSHVAMALARLSKAMDYTVNVVAPGAEPAAFPNVDLIKEQMDLKGLVHQNTCIVVCTQGENDEAALEAALRSEAAYVSFVASRRKATAVFFNLRERGLSFDDLKQIKTPAGLDINAKLPEEVAISILAEIISMMRKEPVATAINSNKDPEQHQPATSDRIFINPVCGIPVEKSTAKHVLEYEGENYYFCCDGCKVSFEKEPEKYAITA